MAHSEESFTVRRSFPTFVAENPCIRANPAGSFLFLVRVGPLSFLSFSLSDISGSTTALFARFLSRRSFRPAPRSKATDEYGVGGGDLTFCSTTAVRGALIDSFLL